MNTYRTDQYSDRSVFRRRIDTEDRPVFRPKCLPPPHHRGPTDHYREKGVKSRLPRLTILSEGMWLLEAACKEATHTEVRDQLRSLFECFGPNPADHLTIRSKVSEAHSSLLTGFGEQRA
jgi:hypothetical protein